MAESADAAHGLDEVDRTLVRELVADGRATLAELAAATGLSVSAVQSRVRRLESRGVVTGYSARVNPDAFGPMLSAFVAITPLDPSQPDDAPARLEHIAEIEACYSVAGEESYVLFVRVASPPALEVLLQQIRTAANVRTRSTVILNTFYSHRVSLPK
ncbi:Lrp/AsnC family transcriptional regulator [Mycolicibacterium aichiense]|uniref:Transcriptional regulator LrpA n=1 Tax=Mycolicibacterium aichiense TaxID=1799 RepID=A0AAD1MAJ3_9MYCO|nr:Lrp/AsnC family transcriptional regulator [Mycolicibacterium aichiense]MCV7017915.1 Lrp/AsnC family transcriptional regulator [Mycolicibacterium aichiense]BBX06468.1 transcriptional regulator LrpA [Mycolicibacterium aichiense]STZ24196.1 AsnC family transcriptional regulator [Mycolicibacterium aichiense]